MSGMFAKCGFWLSVAAARLVHVPCAALHHCALQKSGAAGMAVPSRVSSKVLACMSSACCPCVRVDRAMLKRGGWIRRCWGEEVNDHDQFQLPDFSMAPWFHAGPAICDFHLMTYLQPSGYSVCSAFLPLSACHHVSGRIAKHTYCADCVGMCILGFLRAMRGQVSRCCLREEFLQGVSVYGCRGICAASHDSIKRVLTSSFAVS